MYKRITEFLEMSCIHGVRVLVMTRLADGSWSSHPLVTQPQPDPLVYDGPWGSATPIRDFLFGSVMTYRCSVGHEFSFRSKTAAPIQWCWAEDDCHAVARLVG